MIDEHVDQLIRDVCLEIAKRYEIHFLEIGTDKDHVHFLITICASMVRITISHAHKKYDGKTRPTHHARTEKSIVGIKFMDQWLLCIDHRKAWE